MQKLLKENYNKVLHLLKSINNNVPIVYSLIEGKSKGVIYVDDIENPKTAFLYPENSFFYIVGNEKNESFNKELYKLIFEIADDSEIVLFPLSNNWMDVLSDLFKEKKSIIINRKNFVFSNSNFNSFNVKLPRNLTLEKVDERIAKLLEINKSWVSIDEFLNSGIGYAIMNGDELVSACYSIFVGKGEAEIDILTKDEYQGKGYASLVASTFIQECIDNGLTPSWTCWPFREASVALAKKLGYEETEDIKAFFCEPNM